jgi:hypothetical protein
MKKYFVPILFFLTSCLPSPLAVAGVIVQVPQPIPSQSGNTGKYLTTDGSNMSWGGAVGSVGATAPLSSSGGSTPTISLTGTVPNANTTATSSPNANTIVLRDSNGVAQVQVQNPISTISASTYTIALADNGKILHFTNASNINVTIPSIGTLPAGFNCLLVQDNSGLVVIGTAGPQVENAHGLFKTFGLYAVMTLLLIDTSHAILSGDMQ